MAKKARKKRDTVTISVRVKPEVFKAIAELLDRRPDLGDDKSEFIRRLIHEALRKHQRRSH